MIDHDLTPAEAATILHCSRWFVETRCLRGDIPSYKLGKLRRIRPEDLDAYRARLVAEERGEATIATYRQRLERR